MASEGKEPECVNGLAFPIPARLVESSDKKKEDFLEKVLDCYSL